MRKSFEHWEADVSDVHGQKAGGGIELHGRRVFMIQFRIRDLLVLTAVVAVVAFVASLCQDSEEFGAIILIWAMHAGIASVISAPIVLLSRNRVYWRPWELLVLVLPFLVWCLLMFSGLAAGKKSLANLGEPFYFALGVPIVALARVVVGSRVSERACAISLIAVMCAVAAGVFFIVPSLPE